MLIRVFADFAALNAHLLEGCRKRLADRLRGHDGTIGERLEHDLAVFQKPLPAPYDACDKKPGSVNSLSLVRYRLSSEPGAGHYGRTDRTVLRVFRPVVGMISGIVVANYRTVEISRNLRSTAMIRRLGGRDKGRPSVPKPQRQSKIFFLPMSGISAVGHLHRASYNLQVS